MSVIGFAGWSLAACAGVIAIGLAYGAGYSAYAAARWPAEGRLVETAAGPIQIVEAGEVRADRPTVLLVHGASASNRELRSALEAPLVAAGFHVIAMDRPGFGGSPPFRPGGDRLDGHARAVAALIEALGLEKPIVVGHSYGGAVALRLALDRPGLAGGYLLLGPATHGDVGPVAWYNHLGAAPGVGWVFAHAVVPVAGPIVAGPGLDGVFAPAPAPGGHYGATGVGLVFRPSTFEANSHDLHQVNAELRAQQDRYGEIADPVAIVAGEEDCTVLTARHSERTAAAIPGARLTLLPGVGHMPHHVAPEIIVEHVQALAERVEARRVAAAGWS
jgi:pimeloyl-ACP methyl ester carboxylesterase